MTKQKYNSSKLKESRLRLNTKKRLFTIRMVRYWNMLSRIAADAPSLEVFSVGQGFQQPDQMKDITAYIRVDSLHDL